MSLLVLGFRPSCVRHSYGSKGAPPPRGANLPPTTALGNGSGGTRQSDLTERRFGQGTWVRSAIQSSHSPKLKLTKASTGLPTVRRLLRSLPNPLRISNSHWRISSDLKQTKELTAGSTLQASAAVRSRSHRRAAFRLAFTWRVDFSS